MSKETQSAQGNSGEITGPELVPQERGGALLSGGKPGNRGGGRPPDEFKRIMGEIASGDEEIEYIRRCARGEFGPKFAIAAQKYAADRKYGRPVQAIELSGAEGMPLRTEIVLVKPPETK